MSSNLRVHNFQVASLFFLCLLKQVLCCESCSQVCGQIPVAKGSLHGERAVWGVGSASGVDCGWNAFQLYGPGAGTVRHLCQMMRSGARKTARLNSRRRFVACWKTPPLRTVTSNLSGSSALELHSS